MNRTQTEASSSSTGSRTTAPHGSSPLVLIQHHPARADLLPRILGRIGALPYRIVADTAGDKPSPWRCYRACLEVAAAQPAGARTVILQDDALPCIDFECEVGCSISEEPDAFLVLWLGGQPAVTGMAAKRAYADGLWFARLAPRDWVPAVGTCMTTEHAAAIIEWTDEHEPKIAARRGIKALRSDDFLLGEWHRACKPRIMVTVPSIVEHPDDVPSLIGNGKGSHGKNRARTALFFIDNK